MGGVSTRLPTGIFDTRKPSSSGYSKTKFTASKSSYRPSGGQTLMLPTKSGARSRSGRSKTGSKYTSQMKSRTGASVRSASGWVPTGNMVEIDEGELAELERMIMALTERAEESESRAAQLHQIPIKDVLQFVIKNSNTANVTIGDQVCPP